jgi:hypothetical protein
MDSFFFRVEHHLLRSESFQSLGGSAVKVYLVVGLYSDFGTGWAFPSIRTIARQAGVSRQTVLTALGELVQAGLLAVQREKGRANAYRIIRQAPQRKTVPDAPKKRRPVQSTGQESLVNRPGSDLDSLDVSADLGPKPGTPLAQFLDACGQGSRPEQEPLPRPSDHNQSIPISGTPFRLSAEGRVLVAVDLQGLLQDQGLPRRTAERLAAETDPEAVAKVLLNAFYLRSQGKLQNGPGYIRTGIEEGYDLLPQVATQLESRRRELQLQLRSLRTQAERARARTEQSEEEEAIELVLEQMSSEALDQLVERAIGLLPSPLVRRNPTLSNPFIRAKVYELASGEPASE